MSYSDGYGGAGTRQRGHGVGCGYEQLPSSCCERPRRKDCDPDPCASMCTSTCWLWLCFILKVLCCIVMLVGIVIALVWLAGIRAEVRDLSHLKRCDKIGRHLHSVLFRHYDTDWVHDHIRHDTVVCVDSLPYGNYTGHQGLKRLACHLKYDAPYGSVHYHASYASADCDNSCVVVFRHGCKDHVYDPHRRCDDYGGDDYDDYGRDKGGRKGKDWKPDDHDHDHDRDHDDSCASKKKKHYHSAYDHGSPCDDCFSTILVNLDDYCAIANAHFCYSKHGHDLPEPPRPAPPPY